MEGIYANVKYDDSVDPKASQHQRGPRSSGRRFHGAVVLFLGLLSVFLLAGLIGLGVHYHVSAHGSAADFSIMKENLTERLQASNNKLSSVFEERDLLNASLTEVTKRLICCQKKACPAGWRRFMCSCYLLSSESGSWTRGGQDCTNRGAHLVIIDSTEEQMFLSNFTEAETWSWIGLIDKDTEGTWMWVDGSPLTLRYWEAEQPDNGGGHAKWGEEDCAHIRTGKKTAENWNDRSCDASLRWICEKKI
ncbi:C-type lectin domain family 4 member E-like [Chelmon rostratus]|uniref:C-type lectin domain family 4 member E-like n=1 Tax=Chelmon rostratus TaxID=109905 RepID=UPI001BEA0D9B|nr:C-type lectin domain family 4 member E-like [Chelmon rostratus]